MAREIKLSADEVRQLCVLTGHVDPMVRPNRRRNGFVFRCACGYFSEARFLESEAAQLGVEHLARSARSIMREYPGWSVASVVSDIYADGALWRQAVERAVATRGDRAQQSRAEAS